MHPLFTKFALAIFSTVIYANFAVENGLNDHVVGGWYQSHSEGGQSEVVEGRVVVVQLFLLTTLKVFLKAGGHVFIVFIKCMTNIKLGQAKLKINQSRTKS